MDLDKPNIFLIVLDSVRYDAISQNTGEDGRRTPNIDMLAREGFNATRAYSPGTYTRPVHASIFSGKYPMKNGVVMNKAIGESHVLLAEHLRDEGYSTFGIAGNAQMAREYGYDRGFDDYIELFEGWKPSINRDYITKLLKDKRISRNLIRVLTKGPDSNTKLRTELVEDSFKEKTAPFFGFVNYPICHAKYNAPRPWKKYQTPTLSRPGWHFLSYLLSKTGKQRESLERKDVRLSRVLEAADSGGHSYLSDQDWLRKSELEVLKSWYYAGLQYLDAVLGDFITRVKESSDRDTLVIITADHGEYFGEHGLLYHPTFGYYNEQIHVPLILHGENVGDIDNEKLVSLLDIFPTICDYANISIPDDIDGHSILSHHRDKVGGQHGSIDLSDSIYGGHVPPDKREWAEASRRWIITSEYKYVTSSSGNSELYSMPTEEPIQMSDELENDLEEKLDTEVETDFGETYIPDTDRQRSSVKENLKQLGYLE